MTSEIVLLALVLGVVAGGVIPFQTAINSRLAVRLGAIFPASLISFAVGTAGLGLLVLATGTPMPWTATAATQPWWIWIGGVCGLVFLTMNIVLMPRIGASATVVLPLVGQVFGGLVIDMTGAFDTAVRPLSLFRALGAVLVVVGAAMVNLAGRPAVDTSPAAAHRPHPLLWVVAVLAGSLGAIQTAVNGRLGQAMGSALAAALVSFLVGTAGLLVVNVVSRPRVQRSGAIPWWLFSGGLLGAAFVLVNAFNAPVLGTSLAVSIVLLGQVAAGLVLDHRGWLGVRPRPITIWRLLGAAIVLAGVALVRFAA
ncbi:MAG TPA: DMT family transporter [Propionicimonas sp.]|uniref:DMT family transporter n=1 Tax=Propionicimonas sp. TaxID=1955623 RepID=UPI002F4289B2